MAHFPLNSQTPLAGSSTGSYLVPPTELLGDRLRMVMRYAHLSPGFLSDEVKKLDTFSLTRRSSDRATKGQRASEGERGQAKATRIPNVLPET